MFRSITFAALTAVALLASVHSASAFVIMNGGANGLSLQGLSMQGYSTQGQGTQGAATEGAVSTGLTVTTIELPRAQ